jgi:hypothetical protein
MAQSDVATCAMTFLFDDECQSNPEGFEKLMKPALSL